MRLFRVFLQGKLAWLRPRLACFGLCFVAGSFRNTAAHLCGTCLGILLLAAPAAAQQDGPRAYFKDWLAACRTDGYCSATSYDNPGSASGVADYILRIGRHAEETWWEISFTAVAATADPSAEFTIVVDEIAHPFTPPDEVAAYGAINDFFFTGPKAQALLDALIAGSGSEIRFTGEDGTAQVAEFSLSGLAAALLWIDDRQRRIGSERVAEVPPVGLDRVGSMKQGTGIPAELLARHRQAAADCEPLDTLVHGDDIITAQLDTGTMLYLVPCTAGAYNFLYYAYTGDTYGFQQVYFASYGETMGWGGTPYLVNPYFDPETGILSDFYKGRGIGDCGTSGSWKWQDWSFRLLEFRAKEECDGEPGDWPIVYTAPPLPEEDRD